MQRHVFEPGVFICFQSGRISLTAAKNSVIHIFGTTLSDQVFHKGLKTSVFRRDTDGSDNCDLFHILLQNIVGNFIYHIRLTEQRRFI